MRALRTTVDAYLATGAVGAHPFAEFAKEIGGRYERRGGVHVVIRHGRVVAASMRTPSTRVRPLSTIPCATCGALPVMACPHASRAVRCSPRQEDGTWGCRISSKSLPMALPRCSACGSV